MKEQTLKDVLVWLYADGLPILAIAEIFNVDLNTINGWLKEKDNITKSHIISERRANRIYNLLNFNKKSDLRNLYRFWKKRIENYGSLSELFKAKNLDENSIKTVLEALWEPAQKFMKWEYDNYAQNKCSKNPILDEMREVYLSC